MDKLKAYFNKTSSRLVLSVLSITIAHLSFGQGNCLIYEKNSGERKACELSYQAIGYKQGSRESQILFDSAIAIGPNYAWAYYEKSVPYFKRGLLNEGIKLLNKAVALEPGNHYLCYRALMIAMHVVLQTWRGITTPSTKVLTSPLAVKLRCGYF